MQVPLAHAFNVCANGYCYVSQEINHFLQSFRVVSIKNAGFSKLETRFSCFETRFVRGSSFVPVLSCQAMLLLSLPDLSRKIKGPLLAGYKFIQTTTTSKIDLSSDTSFWIFWPILSELHSLKKVTFCGKIHCQFRCTLARWRLICPFPKKLASHNSMQNKDNKVGNKTATKQERQREKRQQERKIEIHSQRKFQILAFAHAWKTKKLFNYVRLVKKLAFFLANFFVSFSYAN